jgi:hypothetical protein
VSYLQHAATALVNAQTGRVVLVPSPDADPVARTWIAQMRGALSPVAGIAPSLLAMLPPAVDGAELQADAFAAFGMRGESSVRRHVPSLDGADTLVLSPDPSLIWLPAAAASAWPIPMVDARDRVGGVLLAVGGLGRGTKWYPTPQNTMQWGAILDRLNLAAVASLDRPPPARAAGRVRIVPVAGGQIVAFQPFYGWPQDGPPYVLSVAAIAGDSARAAPSLAAALGAPVPSGPVPASPEALRERMRTLYAEMRAALQRNDWVAFGAAFDALGALLDRRQ